MDITKKIDRYLSEGTGSSPDTIQKAKKFEKIMKSPITPEKAKTELFNIIGDDNFYDAMDDTFRKGESHKDIRWFIVDGINRNWLSTKGQKSFFIPGEKDALNLVKKVVIKHTTRR